MSDARENDELRSDAVEQALIRALRALPGEEPPAGFAAGVLRGLQPKRLSWRRRVWLWARTPRPLTVTPLRLAAAAGLVLVLALPLLRREFLPAPGPAPDNGLLPVTFLLPDPEARVRSVAVIGSFNRWNPKGFEMRYSARDQAWVLRTQLPPGSHEYVFLTDDGRTQADPAATLSADDGFGTSNSILFLAGDHEQKL